MLGRLTAEEYERAASDHTELVDGRVVAMTPSGGLHGRIAGRFATYLGEYGLRTGIGEVITAEAGFVTRRNPDRVRAPDVAFVKTERLVLLDDGFFQGPPDVAIEVLSPSDRLDTLLEKAAEYVAAGASLVLIADPGTQRLFRYGGDGVVTILSGDDDLEGGEALPGFRVAVSKLLGN